MFPVDDDVSLAPTGKKQIATFGDVRGQLEQCLDRITAIEKRSTELERLRDRLEGLIDKLHTHSSGSEELRRLSRELVAARLHCQRLAERIEHVATLALSAGRTISGVVTDVVRDRRTALEIVEELNEAIDHVDPQSPGIPQGE